MCENYINLKHVSNTYVSCILFSASFNPDTELVASEFCEALVRLAVLKTPHISAADALEMLMEV